MRGRYSGVLLHLTSLPSRFGIGDLGPHAYRFVDFLDETRQSIWQVLPLNPTEPFHHGSPYHSASAFAGNPLLISPERLVEEGLLHEAEIKDVPSFSDDRVDFDAVTRYKYGLFDRALGRFKARAERSAFESFCEENAPWLEPYALYVAVKGDLAGRPWNQWPGGLRDRDPKALEEARVRLASQIERTKFLQFLFERQWLSLRGYCQEKGIRLFGDLPIYVDYDSVDVWTHPEIFKLNEKKEPYVVAGVPPDYFSRTGQLWGHPVYRWEVLKESGYEWWMRRMAQNLRRHDMVRIDHFRGLVAYWEVPTGETNAINGQWREAPALDFFEHMKKRFPCLPVVAEDLGLITPDVREVVHHLGFPGMKLLLFAFDENMPGNPYIPHNIPVNSIAYTGTHDNNTVRGWFEKEAAPEVKERVYRYLGRTVPPEALPWEFIRLVMMSAAGAVVIPMQDLLGLGEEARMNRPAVRDGNWQWRLRASQLTSELSRKLREVTETYGRA